MDRGEIIIFGGTKGLPLATEICELMGIPVGTRDLGRFSDQEVKLEITQNVRGQDVFIVNQASAPAEDLLETIFLARTAAMSSAARVTHIIPYLGYNRQERKDRSRVPISAKIIIELLKVARANRVLLLDLHSGATAAHFEPEIVHDHLYAAKVTVPYLAKLMKGSYVVASPDVGGVARARKYGQHLGESRLVIFDKVRPKAGEVDRNGIRIIGPNVRNKDVLFIDDMIDSGGTLIACGLKAKKAGANDLYACVTHAIFSKGLDIFPRGLFKEIVVTNSVGTQAHPLQSNRVRVTTVSIAPMLRDAINRLHQDKSLGDLFL